jgi:hypothetical protein
VLIDYLSLKYFLLGILQEMAIMGAQVIEEAAAINVCIITLPSRILVV